MYFQDGGATWRPTLEPLTRMYFQWHIMYTHENTLLLERSKYTLMSIFERTKCS